VYSGIAPEVAEDELLPMHGSYQGLTAVEGNSGLEDLAAANLHKAPGLKAGDAESADVAAEGDEGATGEDHCSARLAVVGAYLHSARKVSEVSVVAAELARTNPGKARLPESLELNVSTPLEVGERVVEELAQRTRRTAVVAVASTGLAVPLQRHSARQLESHISSISK
jgi:hypothetical protein